MLKLKKFLRPYIAIILIVFVLTFLQSIAQLYLPTLMSDIVDTGIVQADVPYILKTGAFMLAVALFGSACMVFASFFASRSGTGFARDIRSAIFRRVEQFSLHEFDSIGTASLITRTTNDVTQVHQVTVMILRMMIMAPMMAIGGIIMAVSKDARLSLVFLVSLPVLAGFITFLATKSIPLFQMMQEKLDVLNRVLRERLAGVRVVRALNRTDHEEKRFAASSGDLMKTAIKVMSLLASLFPVMMLLMNLTAVALVWFGAVRIDQGTMQVGDMMALIQYAMQIMFSLLMAAMMFVMVPRASASAKRINDVLETDPEIVDPDILETIGEMRGYVEFKNVTFSYPGAEAPAIRDITFSASPGEITAVIGGTGSGKSTLVNLILRFYDVDSGAVLVDGIDVRKTPQKQLRSRIGYVPQSSVLFSGSISENVRYGNAGAGNEDIRAALETAQATEFVDSIDEGAESTIAQGGTNISGGQKQRLSIARALVRRPEVYIFDDSFSALDFKTDARLRAALRNEIEDATMFIVAQRVATIMRADRIIVLDDGEICGIGTHKELLETCDVYKQIVLSQLSLEEIA